MGIQYTTNYQIPYLDDATPLNELDTVTRDLALKLDAAMGRAGYVPPDATTFAALNAKVNTLQARVDAAPGRSQVYTLALRSPWTTFGSGRPPMIAWREGRTAFLQGFLKPSAQVTGGDSLMTSVGLPPELKPTTFHPDPVGSAATAYAFPLIANGASVGRLDISAGGSIVASLTATVPAGAWVITHGTWPLD